MINAFGDIGGKRQPPRFGVVADDVVQARFVNGNFTVVKHVDFALVDIDADNFVADIGETCAGNQSDVAGSENGNFHATTLPIGDARR